MSRPISVPNTFATQSGPIPLSQLDANFAALVSADNDLTAVSSYYVDSSGSANQIVVTTPGGVTAALTTGLQLSVKIANTNTATAVTLNVNAQGATPVANQAGAALAVGQLTTGMIATFIYDGTSFEMVGTGSVPFTQFAAQSVNRGLGFAFLNYPTTGVGIDTTTNGITLVANGTIYFEGNSTTGASFGASGGLVVGNTGNVSIPTPSAGSALVVNGVAGQNAIVAQTSAGGNVAIAAIGSGAAAVSVAASVTGAGLIELFSNNTGSTGLGVPTGQVGVVTGSAVSMTFGINAAARLTMGATPSVQSAYNFAGSLTATTATAGTNGATPAQVSQYWQIQINGTNFKIALYNN